MKKRFLEIIGLTLVSFIALGLGGVLAFRTQHGNFKVAQEIKRQTSSPANPLNQEAGLNMAQADTIATVTGAKTVLASSAQKSSPVVLSENTNNIKTTQVTQNDSDNDGLSDELEARYGSNPFSPDTDGDGYLDGEEVKAGFSPTQPAIKKTATNTPKTIIAKAVPGITSTCNTGTCSLDSDNDGLTNSQEKQYNTNPNNPDTDGDGYLDGEEVKAGYSPTVPAIKSSPVPSAPLRSLPLSGPKEQPKKQTEDLTKFLQLAGVTGATLPEVADAKVKKYANNNEYIKIVNQLISAVDADIKQASNSISQGDVGQVKVLVDKFKALSASLAVVPAPPQLADQHTNLIAIFKGYGQSLDKLMNIQAGSPTAQTDAIQILSEIALYDSEAKKIFSQFEI